MGTDTTKSGTVTAENHAGIEPATEPIAYRDFVNGDKPHQSNADYMAFVSECTRIAGYSNVDEVLLAFHCAASYHYSTTGKRLPISDGLMDICCAAYAAGKIIGTRAEREKKRMREEPQL